MIDDLAIGKSRTRKISMNEKTKPAKRATTAKTAATTATAKKAASAVATKAVKAKASKVAAESSAAPTPAPKPAAAARPRKAVNLPKPVLDEGQRAQYVSVAAYYIAERRGFNGSYELADWTQAETEIDNLFREGKLSS
jgi:hypothetical protein